MYRYTRNFLTVAVAVALFVSCKAQTIKTPEPFGRVMFYNVENLYDVMDDTLTDDAEFLPGSKSDWTKDRYVNHLEHTAEVIAKAGLPVVVGLAEIENKDVLANLIGQNPIEAAKYSFVHFDSPDERGIDVAFLYRSSMFTVEVSKPLTVKFPLDPADKTRDILYVRGKMKDETFHFFVNHWPSRREGDDKTKPRREAAAKVVKHYTDSITKVDPGAQIIIMGDFNDYPTDESIVKHLGAKASTDSVKAGNLYILTDKFGPDKGTYKYKGVWGTLDQFVVSSGMLAKNGVYVTNTSAKLGDFDFLLEPDTKGTGMYVKRVYAGPNYLGGYSDHLPILLDLYK